MWNSCCCFLLSNFFLFKIVNNCIDLIWHVYLFHAFPVNEPDLVNVIFALNLSYRMRVVMDFVYRYVDHCVDNVRVMVIVLGLLMPTMNLNIQCIDCLVFDWFFLLCFIREFVKSFCFLFCYEIWLLVVVSKLVWVYCVSSVKLICGLVLCMCEFPTQKINKMKRDKKINSFD